MSKISNKGSFVKGHKTNLGKHWINGMMSEEHKIKLSLSNKGKRIGYKHTEESKKKMSQAHTGVPSPAKGKHKTAEAKKKLSLANIGRKVSLETRMKISGANSNLWKGGITPINMQIRNSLEYKLWRKAVFERDKYTCRFCLIKGGKLNADHIKPFAYYPELRFAIDNGRTLCGYCHKTTDTYGFRNYWKNRKGLGG